MEEARYRASLIKSVVDEIERRPDAADIRGRLSAATLHAIQTASRADHLGIELMMEIDVALDEVLGADGFHEFWRDFASQATRISILKPIAGGVLRLFASPGGLLKMYPRSFGLVGRGLGTMEAEIDDEARTFEATLRGTGPMSRPDLFGRANAASIEGMISMVGHRGEARADWSEAHAGVYRLHATWE